MATERRSPQEFGIEFTEQWSKQLGSRLGEDFADAAIAIERILRATGEC